ncbi:MAG: multicopper oxidase domain-containing protein [Acidimicrobiales bacterium]
MPTEPQSERVNAFSIFAALAGLGGFLLAALAIVVVSVVDNDSGGVAASTNDMVHVRAELTEFAINVPSEIPVGAMLDVVNLGGIEHDLEVRGTGLSTPMLVSGGTAMLDLSGLAPGVYELICTVPGHEGSGMLTSITISETATAPSGELAAGASHDHENMTEEEAARLDQMMLDTIAAFPAETEGVGNVPLEPVSVDADGTKVFELVADITPWEVEPGKIVDAWSYNGMVPGPWIHLEVGERARFVVTNNLPLSTDIHWHGVTVPNDQDGVAPLTQPLIRPGETYEYEFTVVEPMVAMYHAHAHGYKKVPNGMLGAFTVGSVELPLGRTISGVQIPEEIDLAVELPMILNDAGVIGYSLNGKSFPATEPIVVDQDEWILTHYMNEGLQVHPMHLHGMRQLVVARDGIPLDEPYWVDTINVAPGERFTVLVQATEPGVWVWHCHVLTHVERAEGMFGMVTALIVN